MCVFFEGAFSGWVNVLIPGLSLLATYKRIDVGYMDIMDPANRSVRILPEVPYISPLGKASGGK